MENNINDYEYPYNHINREGVWDMNKILVINLLNAYSVINDGCLTIVTNYKTFEDCRVSDLDLNLVYIGNKDNKLFRIELDDIIGIQFIDHMAIVGMKWYFNVATWKDVDESVAESIPPTALSSTLYHHLHYSNKVYTYAYTKLYIFTDSLFSIYNDDINLHWNDI